jgi:hypothetical protein
MQICLHCAREEYDLNQKECRMCGGSLWLPRNVGGQSGNTDVSEAALLIRAGKSPWASK